MFAEGRHTYRKFLMNKRSDDYDKEGTYFYGCREWQHD